VERLEDIVFTKEDAEKQRKEDKEEMKEQRKQDKEEMKEQRKEDKEDMLRMVARMDAQRKQDKEDNRINLAFTQLIPLFTLFAMLKAQNGTKI